MSRWLLPLMTVLALIAAGCGGVRMPRSTDTFSCDDITAIPLRALLKETMSPEAMRERMASLYQVPVEKVEFNLHEDNTAFLNVVKNEIFHTIRMNGMHPYQGSVSFTGQRPSVAKATQCLGEPLWYWAYYFPAPGGEDHTVGLSLFIPAQGALIEATTYGRGNRPPPVEGTIPVSFVVFVVPSTYEAITMAGLLKAFGPDLRAWAMRQMKRWPGKWEAIQVEVDPGLR